MATSSQSERTPDKGSDLVEMTVTERKPPPPDYMRRGAAVVHGNIAYFNRIDSYEIWSYAIDESKWQMVIPENPLKDFGLVIIDDQLTSVGGLSFSEDSNILLSLSVKEGREKEWSRILPPMLQGRKSAACITTSSVLVVIGGVGSRARYLESVEVLHIESKQWTVVSPLPKPRPYSSAVLHNDMLYVACGRESVHTKKSVFACAISDLLTSNNSLKSKMQRKLYPSKRIWRELSSLPFSGSTLVSHKDHLLAFSGRRGEGCSYVLQYNPESDSWNSVSQMKTELLDCLAVTFPGDQLVIVGYFYMFNIDFSS